MEFTLVLLSFLPGEAGSAAAAAALARLETKSVGDAAKKERQRQLALAKAAATAEMGAEAREEAVRQARASQEREVRDSPVLGGVYIRTVKLPSDNRLIRFRSQHAQYIT